MKLAVKKDGGEFQGLAGYHYMLHPIPMDDMQAELFSLMGYKIIDVEDAKGTRLVAEAVAALRHQVEVAYLVDGRMPKSKPV